MLVLSRKVGERIRIGDTIQIDVLAIRGKHVRLGFFAPLERVLKAVSDCASKSYRGG